MSLVRFQVIPQKMRELRSRLSLFIIDKTNFLNGKDMVYLQSFSFPTLLAIPQAKIYDLDNHSRVSKLEELESIRTYYDFFSQMRDKFEK